MRRRDLTGKKFGRLIVKNFGGKKGTGRTTIIQWGCECECGNTTTVNALSLTSGKTKSCGCLSTEKSRDRVTTHGRSKDPVYDVWSNMIARCYRESCPSFKDYGGRGISVCPSWRKSFENFLSDMGERPSGKHSIERVNNNGNYTPKNCIWSTHQKQVENRRNSVNLMLGGVSLCASQWAEKLNISLPTVYGRIKKGETDPQKILSTVCEYDKTRRVGKFSKRKSRSTK